MKIRSIRKAAAAENCAPACSCNSTPSAAPDKPPCCGPPTTLRGGEITEAVPGFIGWLTSGAGRVPQITTTLTWADRIGAWKVRWGIGRMCYIVPPGLYAIGLPGEDAPVVVTANYKMTYDLVRQALAGRSAWLLVLETFGVNVWCAAGKGTFGTDELVQRIEASGLSRAVRHRRLLLPILGAPGVAAHQVRQRSGFTLVYAAIRAEDLPVYLDNGMTTTAAMRAVTFTLRERLVLIPQELVLAMKPSAWVGAGLFALVALLWGVSAGSALLTAYLGAVIAGVVVAPLLLPWLPGPSFALKGAFIGLAWSGAWYHVTGSDWRWPLAVAAFLILPAVSAYYSLNFTGCTTFTSRSGVKKEMRLSMPVMGGALAVSILILVAGRFW